MSWMIIYLKERVTFACSATLRVCVSVRKWRNDTDHFSSLLHQTCCGGKIFNKEGRAKRWKGGNLPWTCCCSLWAMNNVLPGLLEKARNRKHIKQVVWQILVQCHRSRLCVCNSVGRKQDHYKRWLKMYALIKDSLPQERKITNGVSLTSPIVSFRHQWD